MVVWLLRCRSDDGGGGEGCVGKSELNQPNRKPLERQKNKAQDVDYMQKRQTRQKTPN